MRDNNFNFLRLYAGIGVLIGHVVTHMQIPAFGYYVEPDKPFYHLGVPFFFILSGFLLYPSYSKMRKNGVSVLSFWTRRYFRIAPSVYFITIASILIFLVAGALSISQLSDVTFFAWLFSNLILFPVYNPDIFSHIGVGVLNGSLWTIVALVSFYLLVPLIYYFERKFGFKKMIIGLMLLAIVFYGIATWQQTLENPSLLLKIFKVSVLGHLLFFAVGIFWSKAWKHAPKSKWVFFMSVAIVIVLKEDYLKIYENFGELTHILWALPFAYVVIWFGYLGSKIFRVFNKVEDIGMGIYIWHMVVINLFLYLGINEIAALNNVLMHVIVITVTVILAYISRIFIEKPALKLEPYFKNLRIKSSTVDQH